MLHRQLVKILGVPAALAALTSVSTACSASGNSIGGAAPNSATSTANPGGSTDTSIAPSPTDTPTADASSPAVASQPATAASPAPSPTPTKSMTLKPLPPKDTSYKLCDGLSETPVNAGEIKISPAVHSFNGATLEGEAFCLGTRAEYEKAAGRPATASSDPVIWGTFEFSGEPTSATAGYLKGLPSGLYAADGHSLTDGKRSNSRYELLTQGVLLPLSGKPDPCGSSLQLELGDRKGNVDDTTLTTPIKLACAVSAQPAAEVRSVSLADNFFR